MSQLCGNRKNDVCGDCSSSDVNWASVNKGIFLCTQCCSVHRSLGNHITVVKHLSKSNWAGKQREMLHMLNNYGTNKIWEHSLLEGGGKILKKKPTPNDSLSTKQEYIRDKHLKCLYAFRGKYESTELSIENEFNKKLYASVCTANLETSFQLLTLGANPNCQNENGCTPLHLAVQSDQKLQVELLLIYGARTIYLDKDGETALDYARKSGNKELLNRLWESQYEVTDTFSYYLNLRKPDHTTDVHILTPSTIGLKSNSECLTKLKMLPDNVFRELIVDVYDEVTRRESEAIWLSCSDTLELNTVPCLPFDHTLNPARNHGRQKLAKSSTPDLKAFIYDIVFEIQRRQTMPVTATNPLGIYTSDETEEPLYDIVASEEDYAIVPTESENNNNNKTAKSPDISSESYTHNRSCSKPSNLGLRTTGICGETTTPDQNMPALKQDVVTVEMIMRMNYTLEELTKQLKVSDSTITDLKNEVKMLRQSVTRLEVENFELKSKLFNKFGRIASDGEFDYCGNVSKIPMVLQESEVFNGVRKGEMQNKVKRPSSMYEARETKTKLSSLRVLSNQVKHPVQPEECEISCHNIYSADERSLILQCTQEITKTIQALCRALQDPSGNECVICADGVNEAINQIVTKLPQEFEQDRSKLMVEIANRLKSECYNLQMSRQQSSNTTILDQYILNIRDLALQLAKFTKDIVTKYSSN